MEVASPSEILIPTDFSEAADHALVYASSLGERFGATLHVLHAITLHGYEGLRTAEDLPDLGPLLEAADRAARSGLDAGVDHGGLAEAEVVKVVERGVNAWKPILEYAESHEIDLIVMGMRGAGLAHLLLGSVAERVLRLAPCPVLLVEKGDRDFVDPETLAVRLEKVVVADDATEKMEPALAYAASWLAPYRPEMHFVHADEVRIPIPRDTKGYEELVLKLARERADQLRSRLEGHSAVLDGWSTHVTIREGRPERVVPDVASEIGADLLVVAGETHLDLGERILGGTVERMARRAPCPMLVV